MTAQDIGSIVATLILSVVVLVFMARAGAGNDAFDWIVAAGASGVLGTVLWSAVIK